MDFKDITQYCTVTDFELFKNNILKQGFSKTYGNRYNNNPYLKFRDVEFFLNPSHSYSNLFSDSNLSDFNEILIRDKNLFSGFVVLKIVRKGDSKYPEIYIQKGMFEERVYMMLPISKPLFPEEELIRMITDQLRVVLKGDSI